MDTVCGFTTEYLDLIDYNYYTVRCCKTYEYVFVYTCLLLLQLLLLDATVRHRVLDGKNCSRGSMHLIPVFFFSSLKPDIFSMCPLAVLLHFPRRFFLPILHIFHTRYCGHARSQGGR